VQHELLAVMNVAVKLYYEEVPNEKLRSPFRLQALMDKTMDQVQKDHTSAFMKHLLVCDPVLGLGFLKHIQVHYNMNLEPKMLTKKL
jgi:hypothetical protein